MKQADGHHDEIGHHLVVANERSERFDHSPDLIGFVYQFAVGSLRAEIPVRGTHVFERRVGELTSSRDLRLGIAARFVAKQHVVIAVRVKRRVEIDEINRLVLDIVPQNL